MIGDFLYLAVVLALFLITVGLVLMCEHLHVGER
jgi:hypothetical protein